MDGGSVPLCENLDWIEASAKAALLWGVKWQEFSIYVGGTKLGVFAQVCEGL